MTFIQQAGVLKRQEYGSSDSKMFNGNIVAISYANLIKIGPVTLETKGNNCTFLDQTAKIGIFHWIYRHVQPASIILPHLVELYIRSGDD